MIPAEIVMFHLRHNGDVYLAHWYVWCLVIFTVLWVILTVASLSGAKR